jgi:hypothetical protein
MTNKNKITLKTTHVLRIDICDLIFPSCFSCMSPSIQSIPWFQFVKMQVLPEIADRTNNVHIQVSL